jgi:hypothetical protein
MNQYTYGFTYADGVSTISSGLYFYADSHLDALKKICNSKNVRPSDDVIFIEAIQLS